MAKPNFKNRTLFHGDNLDIMRGINSETIDLIATDPPFNKSRDFHATPDSLAKGARFQDRWSWERDVHETWTDQIRNDYPKLMEAIESACHAHSDGMGAYMCFMAVRLLEMRRILKDTGSIYLHCDPTASHYLKAVMDAIFGWKNFRNEIVWKRTPFSGSSKARAKQLPRDHDVILLYSKGRTSIWVPPTQPYSEEYLKRFKWKDDRGFYRKTLLKTYSKDTFERLREEDRLIPPVKEGAKYSYKQYLNESGGVRQIGDVWTDINMLNPVAKERMGYPTQKPLALYERIVKASSNEGDMILDPFAGCATTLVVAERLKRQWVGIDIWDNAHNIVLDRIKNEGLAQEGEDVFTLFSQNFHYRTDVPERDDDGEVSGKKLATLWIAPKEPWQKLTNREMKVKLSGWQKDDNSENVICAGCGRILEKEFMEIDHIQPRSGYGTNFIDNRILLCRPCNGKKSDRFAMKGLWNENKKDGWMKDEGKAKKAGEYVRRGVSIFKRKMYKLA